MNLVKSLAGVAALLSGAIAAPATFSPSTDISLSVSVPASTSSSGSGNIYMQFSAPTTYAWAGFGTGSRMAGSTMFVIYTDGSGNITLSPRNGVGQVMPLYSSTLASSAVLLAGSGVTNGLMVANIRFTISSDTIAAAGTNTNWIAAWQSGAGLATTSPSARIARHDAHAQFIMDLSQAQQVEDVNPFVAAAVVEASTAPSVSATASGAATASGTASGVPRASSTAQIPTSATADVSVPIATSNSGSLGVLVSSSSSPSEIATFRRAHGAIMSIAAIALFPVGAILMRVFGLVWVHAAFMILGYVLMIIGLGLGIYLGQMLDILYKGSASPHTILGTVLTALFLIQPILGLVHHRNYKKSLASASASASASSTHSSGEGGNTTATTTAATGQIHKWYGRVLLILAVVNGGLGFALAGTTRGGMIAYAVFAGVVGVLYVGLVVVSSGRRRRTRGGEAAGGRAEMHDGVVRGEKIGDGRFG